MGTQQDRDGTGLQRQARALGDPTRHAIFRYVDAARRPVTVAELTEHFGLNHNAIRQHLAKLCEAGLLIEELAAPAGPGRRRLHYRAAPAVVAAWGGESPYEQLSLLLLEMLQTGGSPRQVGFEAGRRFASRHSAQAAAEELDALETLVARQGFEPRRIERADAEELDALETLVARQGFEPRRIERADAVELVPRALPLRGRRLCRSVGRVRAPPRSGRRHGPRPRRRR